MQIAYALPTTRDPYQSFIPPVNNANTPFRTTAGLDDTPWLHPTMPNDKPKTTQEFLTIHSSQRDRSQYPDAGKCVIRLSDSARGSISKVRAIRLVSGILPDVSGTVMSQPYLVLRIPELSNGHLVSNDPVMEGAFALLQLDRPLTTNAFLSLKGDLHCMSQVTPTSSTINQLSINILKYDGSVFDFSNGSPDNGAAADPTKNYSLFFEMEREV